MEGNGRGGRGAFLKNAQLQAQRRPGQSKNETEPTTSKGVDAKNKPIVSPGLGRASLLSSLLAKQTLRTSPPPTTTSTDNGSVQRRAVGRGQLLSVIQSRMNSQSVSAEKKQDPSPQKLNIPSPSVKNEKQPVLKHGTKGETVKLLSNYIKLVKTSSDKDFFQYHVSFEPDIDNRTIRFKLMRQIIDVIGEVRVFDGSKLYLPFKLKNNVTIAQTIRYTDEAEIKIIMKLVGIGNSSDRIHLFNVLFKKVMYHLNLVRMGHNSYDPNGSVAIPQHHLEVWPGYVTAIADYEGGIMICCDASFRVLRKVTAYDILSTCVKSSKDSKNEAFRQLVGSVVLTRYNNKTYRIDDIAWGQNPKSTFSTSSGDISFIDYYKKSHDVQIIDLNQPLLISNMRKKDKKEDFLVCLIPELCYMTGLTDDQRNDFRLMKDIASHTRITPNQRQDCLMKFRKNIMYNPEAKKILSDWGLALDDCIVELEGRKLNAENIIFKDGTVSAGATADWSRATVERKVLSTIPLHQWIIVFSKKNSQQVSELVKKLQIVGRKMGMEISDPQFQALPNDSTESYIRCLRDNISNRLQLYVIVFPTSRDDRYSAVKKLCCVEQPVPSQVIIAKTISNPTRLTSVSQKIALQINCKLGGELWGINIPVSGLMICGMDVYHDAKQRGKSVVGFTASMNRMITRWYSNVHFQNPGEELINSLKIFLVSACRKYYDTNHELPKRIVVYRDGVGDDDLKNVLEHEVGQLLSSLDCFGDYLPMLTVVIVQKRINTRIFLQLQNGLQNPDPGTVVDHTINRKYHYDFFLVSQHVRQGTVTPTHYIVVYDTSTLTPDQLQCLTYKVTHMYYNWPGTIRSPAPCQYAHKLAYLVGQNIRKMPSPELSDRLYYL